MNSGFGIRHRLRRCALFFAKKQVRAKDFFGYDLFCKKVGIKCDFIQGAKTIEQLELTDLITDCVVIRVDHEADENYVVMSHAVEQFEAKYGAIKPNTFAIFYTGWEKHWGTPASYQNNFKFPIDERTTIHHLKSPESQPG